MTDKPLGAERREPGLAQTVRCVIPDDDEAARLAKAELGATGAPLWPSKKPRANAENARTCQTVVVEVIWEKICWGAFANVPATCFWTPREVTEEQCSDGGGWSGSDPCDSSQLMPDADQIAIGCDLPGGGGTAPPSDPDPKPCNTGDRVIDSPGFATGAQAMRDASSMDAPSYRDRLETFGLAVPAAGGGWVAQPFLRDNQYGFRYWDRASPRIPHASAQPPGTVPIHTHPFRRGERYLESVGFRAVRYAEGPGPADGPALAATGYARGFIIDKLKIYVYDLTGQVTAEYNRCGY